MASSLRGSDRDLTFTGTNPSNARPSLDFLPLSAMGKLTFGELQMNPTAENERKRSHCHENPEQDSL
jgi:hypothetical protein